MLSTFDLSSARAVNTGVAMTLFFAIAWGLMFKDMLEYEASRWQQNRKTQAVIEYTQPRIVFTYGVTCLLLVIFSIFSFLAIGFPLKLAAIFSAVMVLFPAILIWVQLGTLLKELVQGGSQALEIDGEMPLAGAGNGEPVAVADEDAE